MISDDYEDDYEDIVETPKEAPIPKTKPLVTLKILGGVSLSKPRLRTASVESQPEANDAKSDSYSNDEADLAEFKKTAAEYHKKL